MTDTTTLLRQSLDALLMAQVDVQGALYSGVKASRIAAAVKALQEELAQPAPAVPADMVMVPLSFVQGFNTLAHNWSLRAEPPSFYTGTEGDAFSRAYAECGEALAKLRDMIAAAPGSAPAAPAVPAVNCEWTNCPRRVGDVCCNERAAPAVQPPMDDPDCKYIAPMGKVCNKCGRIHRGITGDSK